MEECELFFFFFLRQSPDGELERLIKLVRQNVIIEASALQIPPEKPSFSPYLFPKCDRAFYFLSQQPLGDYPRPLKPPS